jgi:hypothetical protein
MPGGGCLRAATFNSSDFSNLLTKNKHGLLKVATIRRELKTHSVDFLENYKAKVRFSNSSDFSNSLTKNKHGLLKVATIRRN